MGARGCYTFRTHTSRHYFCISCGCRRFYAFRSNPDGYSVKVRCVDKETIESVTVHPFGGKQWKQRRYRGASLEMAIPDTR